MSSIWNVGGVNPLLVGWYQFINNVDFLGNQGITLTEDPTTPMRVFGASLDPTDAAALAGKGTIHLLNPLGVPADGALGAGLAFSRVGSYRRGAAIIAFQDGAFNQTGLKFYTRASATTGNETLNGNPALTMFASGGLLFPVSGDSRSNLTSGSYIPVLTLGANVAAAAANVCYWLRVGNVVTVTISITVDPTAATTQTEVVISLPVPSNFTTFSQCTGTATRNPNGLTANVPGIIIGDTVADGAILRFYNDANVGNYAWHGIFQYVVI